MTVEWYQCRELCAKQVGDQVRRGSKRPYVVSVDGKLVIDAVGRARRFSTAAIALAAARLELRRGIIRLADRVTAGSARRSS